MSNTTYYTMTTTSSTCTESPTLYDRRKELEEFEATKLGVKGLLDSGITQVPRMFHHPSPENHLETHQLEPDNGLIPVIDLSGPHAELVARVREASSTLGFFQVINHGIPVPLLDRLINGVRAFHEQPAKEKESLYKRDVSIAGEGVGFYCNYDLFWSKAASWRDTLEIRLGPDPVDPIAIPYVCRDEVIEWDKGVKELAERLMGLLAEGLGLREDRLKGVEYLGRRNMVGHYYPYCPQPEKTVGLASHTDAGMLTVLLQDQLGGLQVNHQGKWLDLKPVHGALVINIGDIFQMISNDEYKSGEHRVVANPLRDPRVSIGVFCNPGINEDLYGPLPELISPEKPPLYRQFTILDFLTRFLSKELEGKSMTNYYRL